jgi:ABC-2 type transport system ATP-binding protein
VTQDAVASGAKVPEPAAAPGPAAAADDEDVLSVDEAASAARASGLTTDMPFGSTVIDAVDLGVRYSLRLTRKNTVRQTFTNMFKRREGPKDFWALRDVSFRLVSGESLAIIGPNGAGKSTLLQVLAGIIVPSSGRISVRGRISSLLTLGAGFDPELSGRENILLAGAFMGMSDAELRERVEHIVRFADIGEFIDASIKTYSSGMRARLGFAIATSVDPDVLLLDEVLATGDQVFRAKSRARVGELVKLAKGIVLVTHDMTWVTEYCNRAILLEKGRIVLEGEPQEVVALHQEHSAQAKARQAEEIARYGGAIKRP